MTQLSAVVPVSRMAGKLGYLSEWLTEASKYDLEIIIVHDKQDSQTSSELRSLISNTKNPRIIFIEGLFGNPGGARNAGLERVTGNWIVFWDSDDLPCINKILTETYDARNDVEVVIGQYQVINVNTGIIGTNGEHKSIRDVAMNPGLWRMIFKSESIQGVRFPNLRMAEDQVFLSRIRIAEKRVKFTSNVLYKYHTGFHSQLTNSKNALSDLPQAIRQIGSHASFVSSNQLKFNTFLMARQLFTTLTKAPLLSRIPALVAIFKLDSNRRVISLWYLAESMSYIVSHRRGR